MSSPTLNTILEEFGTAVLAEIDTVAKPSIIAMINAGEVKAEAALAAFLNSLPKPGGIEGAIVAPIETALENAANNYAVAAVAKYGGEVIFTLLDAQLHAWVAKIAA